MEARVSGARLKVLVCGGGIAGQAVAYWLARGGHRVVVAERFPALRAAGAQVDLRGQGIEVIERMGLLDDVRSRAVPEPGVGFVDSHGRRWGAVLANTSGKGRQTLTSELEIMRGDLVRILHGAANSVADYRFGKSVKSLDQDEKRVVAHFSDGTSEEFDLLVGADGQSSRVRRWMMPADAPEPYRTLGFHMAYWFIPRIASDTDMRDSYSAPGGRMIWRRSHSETETQVYFRLWEQSAEASAVHRQPIERQKQFWTNGFRDAGWQTERFLEGMRTAEFFYSQEVLQVRTDTWHSNRVVLVGDAGYCPSPQSGMGTSGALVGAYVLAGEINKNPGDLPRALSDYQSILRPFVESMQTVASPVLLRASFPQSRLGVRALLATCAVTTGLKIPQLAARFAKEDRGGTWELPEYPRPGIASVRLGSAEE